VTAAGQEPADAESRSRGTSPADPEERARIRTGALTIATVVATAFAVYGLLSTFVNAPRVFGDEVIYMDAADSLADGHGLRVQGERYGRGPGYPAAIAPILVATQNRTVAYLWIKLANALVFALTAVPIYLLARRLLSRRASAAVAALSLAIPSSIYVGLVMTDSLAYLVSSIALLAVVLTVERPTWQRQIATFGAIALAYLVRPQFIVLLAAYALSLAAAVAIQPDRRRRADVRELWPTAMLLVMGTVAAVVLLMFRRSSTLGDYSFLWRSYSIGAVARWTGYHAADLALYVGLLPVALLPCVLVALHRGGRRASEVFLPVVCTVTTLALLAAGAFGSTPYSQSRLYDRYVFYVIPLWLIAGAVWLREGAPRPRGAAAAGVSLLLGVIVVFPFDTYVVDDAAKQLHAAATPLWAQLESWAVGHGQTGHRAIAVVALVAVALAYVVPRRFAWTLAVPIVAVFMANSALLWQHGIDDWDQQVFTSPNTTGERWIDDVVPNDETVSMLDVSGPHCDSHLGYAYVLTEFFNDRVDSEARVGVPAYGDIPSFPLHVTPDGRLVRSSGKTLTAQWLVAPRGVELKGTRAAVGTLQRLVLWHIEGPVRVRAGSDRQLEADACEPGSSTGA